MAWKVWSKVWLLICKNLHYKPLSSIQTLPNLDWTHSKSLMQTTLLIWSCLHINSMAGIRSCLSNRHNPIQLTSTANHTFITLIMYWQLTRPSREWLTNIDTFQQHRWPDSESRAMRHPDWVSYFMSWGNKSWMLVADWRYLLYSWNPPCGSWHEYLNSQSQLQTKSTIHHDFACTRSLGSTWITATNWYYP